MYNMCNLCAILLQFTCIFRAIYVQFSCNFRAIYVQLICDLRVTYVRDFRSNSCANVILSDLTYYFTFFAVLDHLMKS